MTRVKETVLIVDDQQNWRDVLSKMLEKDYAVETAANYEDAKAILQQKAFLLAIIDIRLVDEDKKNVDGIRLLADLRQFADGASAIIITGYPELWTAKDAVIKYKAFDYILKYPEDGCEFDLSAFREKVQNAIEFALRNSLLEYRWRWRNEHFQGQNPDS
jgi:Response regulator containing CheY-like receiver, AAA-type ATPase, and DNA-binding domains